MNLNMFYGETKGFFEDKNCVHTACEIAHQPLMWRQLSSYLKHVKDEIRCFLDRIGCLSNMRIILTGAGSSGFVGRAVSGFVAKSYGISCEAIHTTDIVSAPEVNFPALYADKPTLLVSFARSGNSPESEGAVRYARKKVRNLYEIAIVCDGNSRLSKATRESDNSLVLVMPEGTNDKGFAMTSSVSTMILAGFAVLCPSKFDDITREICLIADLLVKVGPYIVNSARDCASWGFERVWYLGSGPFMALAHEGALKMLELSYGTVVAGHNNSAEFRHGPKTVINPKTVTLHFISNDAFTAKYDIDLLQELYNQRDGNKVVAMHGGLTPIEADLTVEYDVNGLTICADVAAGLQVLLFMQLLSMFTSLGLGISTDNPSPSGLVNRVVQGVTVYPLADSTKIGF